MLYVGTDREPTKPINLANPVGLLPLLELDPDQVMLTVDQKERERGWTPGIISTLILPADLLRTAVSMRSEYWTDLALGWIASLRSIEQASETLTGLATASWASQNIRHRAQKLLNRR
ncbi:hypothetical protein ACIRRA_43915 [Nocardia sp. NPDC101769]|uniref:hypothetical protein n=1 Tax=Nocardia sp. NPDC101769 TaxID=3364333 RepID=UPI003822602C